MGRNVLSMPLVVLALLGGAASGAWPQGQELALRGPRFIAAWKPSGEVVDVSNTVVLRRRVSLDLTNVTADEALKEITRQADLEISYSKAMLPNTKSVSLHAREITVAAALTEALLDTGVDVAVSRGGYLGLVRRPASAPAEVPAADTGAISGSVIDEATQAPIVGALVDIEGTPHGATTESDGRYHIAGVPSGTYRVRARYIGYAPEAASVTVSAGAEATVNFVLTRSVQVLDEVVTTGTVLPTEVKALPTPITVLTEEDIALQRPRTVGELFRQAVPGGVSWDLASDPSSTSFSVRGTTTFNTGGNQMKTFVDGIEVAQAIYASVDPNSIARIEVIRGPQAAAIYGSDAIGGVIQIFTKRGDPNLTRPRVEGHAAFGVGQSPYPGKRSAFRQEYTASVTGAAGPGASYRIGGGYSRLGDWLPSGDVSRQSHPHISGSTHFASGPLTGDLSTRYEVHNVPEAFSPDLAQTGDLFYSRPFHNLRQVTNQAVGARLGLAPTQWWQHTLTLGIDRAVYDQEQTQGRLFTPDDTLLTVINQSWTKRSIGYNTSVQGALASSVSGTFTAGVDYYSISTLAFFNFGSTGTTTGIFPADAARVFADNTGYFAQGQFGLRDALFLTAGVRAEQNTGFGDSLGTPLMPRAGLSYVQPLGGTTLKLRGSWGRSIKAPDPTQKLAGPDRLPNLVLGPERNQGWDAGLDAVFGRRGSVSITYYDQTADNLIDFLTLQIDTLIAGQWQNVGRVKNTGVEVEGLLALGPVRLKGTYGYVRSRIKQLAPGYTGSLRVGDQATQIPAQTGGALLTTTPREGTTVSAGMAYVGSYRQFDLLAALRCGAGTGPCREDYVVEFPSIVKVNATLWQRITPQVSGFLSVDNLTNSHVAESVNFFPVMGRISTIGLRVVY